MSTSTGAERRRAVEGDDFRSELEAYLQVHYSGYDNFRQTNFRGAGSPAEYFYFRHGAKEYVVKAFFDQAGGEEGEFHVRAYTEFQQWLRAEQKPEKYLEHSPILPAVDFVREGVSRPFVILQYAAGGTLKDVLRAPEPTEGTPVPELRIQRLRTLLDQLSPAFEFFLAKGYVHRDIKPENIFLLESILRGVFSINTASVADLGSSNQLSTSQVMIGTPAYMAPETLAGRSNDEKADAFSLGVVLYQMLSGGAYPFGDMQERFGDEIDNVYADLDRLEEEFGRESPQWQARKQAERDLRGTYIDYISNIDSYVKLADLPEWQAWVNTDDTFERVRRTRMVADLDNVLLRVVARNSRGRLVAPQMIQQLQAIIGT